MFINLQPFSFAAYVNCIMFFPYTHQPPDSCMYVCSAVHACTSHSLSNRCSVQACASCHIFRFKFSFGFPVIWSCHCMSAGMAALVAKVSWMPTTQQRSFLNCPGYSVPPHVHLLYIVKRLASHSSVLEMRSVRRAAIYSDTSRMFTCG
jgi:hypothetical protein